IGFKLGQSSILRCHEIGYQSLKSAKQSIFATSSAEAEYIAAFDAFKEAVWVRKFISGLGVVPIIEEPIMGTHHWKWENCTRSGNGSDI
nr:retrovirus-related Pol polyprotein from transposon TNT 1-94 [Tanacetum cinerariifolium]